MGGCSRATTSSGRRSQRQGRHSSFWSGSSHVRAARGPGEGCLNWANLEGIFHFGDSREPPGMKRQLQLRAKEEDEGGGKENECRCIRKRAQHGNRTALVHTDIGPQPRARPSARGSLDPRGPLLRPHRDRTESSSINLNHKPSIYESHGL